MCLVAPESTTHFFTSLTTFTSDITAAIISSSSSSFLSSPKVKFAFGLGGIITFLSGGVFNDYVLDEINKGHLRVLMLQLLLIIIPRARQFFHQGTSNKHIW
ncbi:unnamed protein product [Trifolium pratense]|uniref:Uncharacterized protein n=1 Tax=Trifolium pratense TaxID=57577 RepID=A0ACB0KL18_TRIPR|nr:unnamed protein product [Trifolium pratense]